MGTESKACRGGGGESKGEWRGALGSDRTRSARGKNAVIPYVAG